MGELGGLNSKGNGLTAEDRLSFCFSRKSSPPPDPSSFGDCCLSAAEKAAHHVVGCIHPTFDSEEKRRDVIEHIQRLIKRHLNCEVVSYGSVPLKTYLPDGDIDLTVIKGPNVEESLARDVLAILQGEEKNDNVDYRVKDTQFIDAEVKLVKCIMRDTVIDVSFNQLGGISTLCFLEKVDRLVGRDHLFKRSIILVKTWCYYESRILGAHHGLISTYALEVLVLYIFQFFHSSLSGPLAVLYKFLDYYSQFDWDNYCISLKGPVYKSSLPGIVVKRPERGWNDLMLSEEFLDNCMETFSVPCRGLEANQKAFQIKHLNIIDPLKENNNLGRSVHRGNFYRIRRAFMYGASKLGQVLLRPRDKVSDEICEYFANTLARHGHRYRHSIRHSTLEFGDEESFTASLSSPVESFSEDDMLMNSTDSDIDNNSVDVEEKPTFEFNDEVDRCSNCLSSQSSLENLCSDATQVDLACASPNLGSVQLLANREKQVEMNSTYSWCMDNSEFVPITDSCLTPVKANILENLCLGFREIDLTSVGVESEYFSPLADLSGDYESHIRSLLTSRLTLSVPVVCNSVSPPYRIHNKKPSDIVLQSVSLRQNKSSQMNLHTTSMEHTMYSAADSPLLGAGFRSEEKQKARGTGTYYPHMDVYHKDRAGHGRGKNKAPGNHNQVHKYGHINSAINSYENCGHEVQSGRSRGRGRGRSDICCQSPRSVGSGNQSNGYISTPSCKIEFGSIGMLEEEIIFGSADVRGSTAAASPKTQGSPSVTNKERVVGRSIRLKNENEFPPLTR